MHKKGGGDSLAASLYFLTFTMLHVVGGESKTLDAPFGFSFRNRKGALHAEVCNVSVVAVSLVSCARCSITQHKP